MITEAAYGMNVTNSLVVCHQIWLPIYRRKLERLTWDLPPLIGSNQSCGD
jgi:hypothetical protein